MADSSYVAAILLVSIFAFLASVMIAQYNHPDGFIEIEVTVPDQIDKLATPKLLTDVLALLLGLGAAINFIGVATGNVEVASVSVLLIVLAAMVAGLDMHFSWQRYRAVMESIGRPVPRRTHGAVVICIWVFLTAPWLLEATSTQLRLLRQVTLPPQFVAGAVGAGVVSVLCVAIWGAFVIAMFANVMKLSPQVYPALNDSRTRAVVMLSIVHGSATFLMFFVFWVSLLSYPRLAPLVATTYKLLVLLSVHMLFNYRQQQERAADPRYFLRGALRMEGQGEDSGGEGSPGTGAREEEGQSRRGFRFKRLSKKKLLANWKLWVLPPKARVVPTAVGYIYRISEASAGSGSAASSPRGSHSQGSSSSSSSPSGSYSARRREGSASTLEGMEMGGAAVGGKLLVEQQGSLLAAVVKPSPRRPDGN